MREEGSEWWREGREGGSEKGKEGREGGRREEVREGVRE